MHLFSGPWNGMFLQEKGTGQVSFTLSVLLRVVILCLFLRALQSLPLHRPCHTGLWQDKPLDVFSQKDTRSFWRKTLSSYSYTALHVEAADFVDPVSEAAWCDRLVLWFNGFICYFIKNRTCTNMILRVNVHRDKTFQETKVDMDENTTMLDYEKPIHKGWWTLRPYRKGLNTSRFPWTNICLFFI